MRLLILLITAIYFWLPFSASAENVDPSIKPLKVAIVLAEPFGMKSKTGYYGIAIDIWKQIAAANLWEYEFIEHRIDEYEDAINKLRAHEYDVLVGPTASTGYREQLVDFSRPYYLDYVGSVIKVSLLHSILHVMGMFLYSAGILLLVFLLFYTIHLHLIWFFERKNNNAIPQKYVTGLKFVLWSHLSKNHYIGSPVQNIGLPKSFTVRTSLFLWIGIAYVLTTLISGTVVSFMTVSLTQAEKGIQKPGDLKGKVIGALEGTYPYVLGQNLGFKMKPLKSFKDGIQELEVGDISALITDHSSALFQLQKSLNPRILLSPLVLKYSLYGFAFPTGSPLKESLNESLVKFQNDGTVLRLCKEYIPDGVKNCQL